MIGLIAAHRIFFELVQRSWQRALASSEPNSKASYDVRAEVKGFEELLITGALLNSQGNISQAARALRFKHSTNLSVLLEARHSKLSALKRLRQGTRPEWLGSIEATARELANWLTASELTYQQAANWFEHDLIKLALIAPQSQYSIKGESSSSVSRAARLLGFKYHQALISRIKTRHKDLLDVRTKPRRRPKSIMYKQKPVDVQKDCLSKASPIDRVRLAIQYGHTDLAAIAQAVNCSRKVTENLLAHRTLDYKDIGSRPEGKIRRYFLKGP